MLQKAPCQVLKWSRKWVFFPWVILLATLRYSQTVSFWQMKASPWWAYKALDFKLLLLLRWMDVLYHLLPPSWVWTLKVQSLELLFITRYKHQLFKFLYLPAQSVLQYNLLQLDTADQDFQFVQFWIWQEHYYPWRFQGNHQELQWFILECFHG